MSADWDFCDRSPCRRLLESLGHYVFGEPDTGNYVMIFIPRSKRTVPTKVEIRYCPFCGVRLDNLQLEVSHPVHVGRPTKRLKGGR